MHSMSLIITAATAVVAARAMQSLVENYIEISLARLNALSTPVH